VLHYLDDEVSHRRIVVIEGGQLLMAFEVAVARRAVSRSLVESDAKQASVR